MSDPGEALGHWRRAAGYYAWRTTVAALIVLVVGWDAVSLLAFPDTGYASVSFTFLRNVNPWGMRGYGPPLAVLFMLTLYAFGRHRGGAGNPYILMRGCLGAVAAWYTMWTFGIVGSWFVTGEVGNLGVGELLFIAVVSVILARTTPSAKPPSRR
ncbi:MAG TPA: hypothetical protein VK453_25440 [Micromonosporaceae bacterium]|nr:hypothetical protein [Micromonosporaceae bacterium]